MRESLGCGTVRPRRVRTCAFVQHHLSLCRNLAEKGLGGILPVAIARLTALTRLCEIYLCLPSCLLSISHLIFI